MKVVLTIHGTLLGEVAGNHLASLAHFYDPNSFHNVNHHVEIGFDAQNISLTALCNGKGLLHKIQVPKANLQLSINSEIVYDGYGVEGGLDFGDIAMFDLRRLYNVMLRVLPHRDRAHKEAGLVQTGTVTVTVVTKDRDDLDECSERFFEEVPRVFNIDRVSHWLRMHDVLRLKPKWSETEFDCIISTLWFRHIESGITRSSHEKWCRWCESSKREKLLANIATRIEAHRFLGGYVSSDPDWVALRLGKWEFLRHNGDPRTGKENEMPLSAFVALGTIHRWFTKNCDDVVIPFMFRPRGRIASKIVARCISRELASHTSG